MFNLLKFDNALPEVPRDERRTKRHATTGSVRLSSPGTGMFDGVLIDLSIHGARVLTLTPVLVNEPVLLEIETMPLLSGRVKWAEGRELGMRFDRDLHESVLDYLLEKSGLRRA